jgi:hypothetical protein
MACRSRSLEISKRGVLIYDYIRPTAVDVKLSNTFGLIIEADRPRLVRDAVKQFEAASALTRW